MQIPSPPPKRVPRVLGPTNERDPLKGPSILEGTYIEEVKTPFKVVKIDDSYGIFLNYKSDNISRILPYSQGQYIYLNADEYSNFYNKVVNKDGHWDMRWGDSQNRHIIPGRWIAGQDMGSAGGRRRTHKKRGSHKKRGTHKKRGSHKKSHRRRD